MSAFLRFTFIALAIILCTCVSAQKDLYDLERIVEVELEMHDPHWKKKLNSWKKNNLSKRTLATLRVDGVTYDSVGVRLKGNSSYFAPAKAEKKKLPFNIKVSYTDKSQRVDGRYRTLKLSNVFRDPSYLREALSYQIARDYVAAPDCNYARLTVDGDYFGMYNLTESVDELFWSEEFASEEGLLIKCDPESKDAPPSTCPPGLGASLAYLGQDSACYAARYEIKKSDHGWLELINLAKAVSNEKADLSTVMNVDEALWMLAFNNAMSNLDSYLGAFCHNYYLFKDASGYWRPVIWDLNLSAGGFRLVTKKQILTDQQLVELSPFLHFSDRNEERPLILRLLDKPLYRKMYVAHLQTIFEEQFTSGLYRERAEKIRSVITPQVVQEPNPLYPTETYTQNYHGTVDVTGGKVIGVDEFFKKRGAFLAAHKLFQKPPPAIADHTATKDGGEVTVSVTLEAGQASPAVWVAHRPKGRGGFTYSQLKAVADGNYSLGLPEAEIEEYFVVAEGAISATVLPARSGREWFTVGESKK
ncbi:CotH kinase family protein [Neolewinella agarilytica]|uniref:CotH protein n=1 Tax=Neolewinella agarilytica TaxID=478744 RepID=A0A1H9J0A3_9BACT|nr:CotH kinase family protein [Neolewinella agarilytica]SEQ80167.1 CotH protein [Neolewinella agarilytica]